MAAKPDPSNGPCVLGIDAAWTALHPSGVALVQRTTTSWSCLSVVPQLRSVHRPGIRPRLGSRAEGHGQQARSIRAARPQTAHWCRVSCVSVGSPGHHTDHRPSSDRGSDISSRTPRRHRRSAVADFAALGYPHPQPLPDRVLCDQSESLEASTGTEKPQRADAGEQFQAIKPASFNGIPIPKPSEHLAVETEPLVWEMTMTPPVWIPGLVSG